MKTKKRETIVYRALRIVQKYFPKVQSIEDGTKPLEIEVTSRDSNSAAVRNHESCAMAVACKRMTKADGVIVSMGVAYVIKGSDAIRYRVPPAVQREIVSFDRNAGFAEGQYYLIPPGDGHKLGESGTRSPAHKNGTGKRNLPKHITTGIRTVLGSKEDLG